MSNSSINDSSSSQWVRRCGGMCEKEIISTDDIIRCSGFCKKFFHNKCTSLTPAVIKELNKGATVFFRCNECSDYDAKFVQYFESLTMRLVKIEKSNSTLKDYVQSRFDDMEKKFESSEKVLVDGVKKVDEKMSFSNVLKNTATSDGVPTIVNKGKKKKKASLFIPAASPSSGADKMSRDEIKSVSSASSNSDENGTSNSNNQSSGVFSSSANENLFSISEDTPQNSPMKTIPLNNTSTPSSSKPVQKKLSHSSVATDVSFRLPHSDHQPINSPQSDWESASLVAEDSSITSSVGVQLEQISKEDIYKAYTEIKQQYRELKLEQQALRLEMDNLQCVVKTLKTKLELPGEKPDTVLNGSLSSSLKEEPSLITLSSDNDTSNEYVKLEGKESKVKKFEANMKLQLSEALSSTLKSLKSDLEAIVKKETAQLLDEIENNSQKHEKELNATKTDSTNFSITPTTPSSPKSNSNFYSSHDSGFASTPNTSLTPITINVSPIRSTSTTQNPLVAGRNHSSSPGTCSTAHNTGHNRQPYQPYQEGNDYIMQDKKSFEPQVANLTLTENNKSVVSLCPNNFSHPGDGSKSKTVNGFIILKVIDNKFVVQNLFATYPKHEEIKSELQRLVNSDEMGRFYTISTDLNTKLLTLQLKNGKGDDVPLLPDFWHILSNMISGLFKTSYYYSTDRKVYIDFNDNIQRYLAINQSLLLKPILKNIYNNLPRKISSPLTHHGWINKIPEENELRLIIEELKLSLNNYSIMLDFFNLLLASRLLLTSAYQCLSQIPLERLKEMKILTEKFNAKVLVSYNNLLDNMMNLQKTQPSLTLIQSNGKFLCQFEPCLTKEDRPCFETREKFQHHASKRHNFKPCQTCHEQVRSGDFKKHGEKHKSDDTKRLLN